MAVLEAVMKKPNTNIDSNTSSSHGHALSSSGFSLNATSTSSSDDYLIYFGEYYHMAKDKAKFFSLYECKTKKIFFGDDRSLSVVGYETIQVDNGHLNDVLCVPSLSYNISLVYQITH
jgi:hypothetical protein